MKSMSSTGHGMRRHAKAVAALMIWFPILVLLLSNVELSSALLASSSGLRQLRRSGATAAGVESSIGCRHANNNNNNIGGAMPSSASYSINRSPTIISRFAFTTSSTSSLAATSSSASASSDTDSQNHHRPLRWARNIISNCHIGSKSKNTRTRSCDEALKSQSQQQPQRRRSFPPRGILCAFASLLVSHIIAPHFLLPINNIHNSGYNNYGILQIITNLFLPLAYAGGGGMAKRNPDAAPLTPLSTNELASKLTIWLAIFTGLALLHAAEIAITTLYPWKVREFAEEEEKQRSNSSGGGGGGGGMGSNRRRQRRGTFQTLNEDITRVLTTILVTSTACSIYPGNLSCPSIRKD